MQRLELDDPLYGRIDLSPVQPVFDSPPMQRMGYIKQLGGVYLVRRAALHSRLIHMAGTAWIAYRRGRWLKNLDVISGHDVTLLTLAALVHDVGHWSFSHFLEPCFGNHDDRGIELIRGELAPFIQQCGDARDRIDPEEVAELCLRQHWLSDIIFPNPLGADKLNYLALDAYFALSENVDFTGLFTRLVGWDRKAGLYVKPEGITMALRAVHHSWHMFTHVYEHPNPRVIQRYIQELTRQMSELDPVVNNRLFDAGEDAVMGAIGYWCANPQNQGHECVERHQRLVRRDHPKKALVFSPNPYLVQVDPGPAVAKVECDPALLSQSETWSMPKLAEIEGQLAELIGTTPSRVSLAVSPPARRWKVPDVKIQENGSIRLLGDLMPEMHQTAAGEAKIACNAIVAVDEPLRERVASDPGLQANIRTLLEQA